GAGGNLKIGGEALVEHDERVVARGLEALGQRLEDATVVVLDARRLAVHLLRRPRHRSPERLADGLMAEADAEDRGGLVKAMDEGEGDAGAVRSSRAGGDHDTFGGEARDLLHGDPVVADHPHGRAQLTQILDQVVGEGIVVVENEDHAGACWDTRRARIMPRALEQVSSHSVLGSESATMPAPTCMEARPAWQTTVRMVIHESRLPEYEM